VVTSNQCEGCTTGVFCPVARSQFRIMNYPNAFILILTALVQLKTWQLWN